MGKMVRDHRQNLSYIYSNLQKIVENPVQKIAKVWDFSLSG